MTQWRILQTTSGSGGPVHSWKNRRYSQESPHSMQLFCLEPKSPEIESVWWGKGIYVQTHLQPALVEEFLTGFCSGDSGGCIIDGSEFVPCSFSS